MKLMQSFASKGLVVETYNWCWYYYYLNENGITYLRQYLGIPDDIVPATLKVTPQTNPTRQSRPPYDGEKMKGAGPGGDFQPQFSGEGGFGRGRGRDNYRSASGGPTRGPGY